MISSAFSGIKMKILPIFFCVVLFSFANTASAKHLPELEIDENENSQKILDRFFEKISTSWAGGSLEEFTRRQLDKISSIENEFNKKMDRALARMLELQLLIKSQPKFAPYFVSFYFRQIVDLESSFSNIIRFLESTHLKLKSERDELINKIEMIKGLKLERQELFWLKEWLYLNVQPLLDSYQDTEKKIGGMLSKAKDFKEKLNTLYTNEEKNVQDNYQKYYCYRFDSLGDSDNISIIRELDEIYADFDEWTLSVGNILEVILPDREFIPSLLISFLVILLFAYLLLKIRRIKIINFVHEKEFLRPYIFFCIGVYFSFCIAILPSTNDIAIFSLAAFFSSLAVLDFSWKMRCKWTGASGMNPFFCFIFAFILLDFMISMLMPVSVLLTLIILVSIFELIWLSCIFRRRKYPMTEIILGGAIPACAWLFAGVAAWIGYLYPALLISIITGLLICILYTGSVMTHILAEYAGKIAHRQVFASFILIILIPFVWLAVTIAAFLWAGQIFNAGRILQIIFDKDLLPDMTMDISLKLILILILSGLLLRFLLIWLKHMFLVFIKAGRFDSGTFNSAFLIFQYIAWSIFIICVFNSLKIDWNSIKWVIGGMSVGLGFALKELLENFVCGIILLIGKEVRPGDMVEFDHILGFVEKINIRATFIKTTDNALISIPNNQVVSKDFRNWTLNNRQMRREVNISVAYGSDLNKVFKLLQQAAEECRSVLKIKKPEVLFMDFGDSGLFFKVRFWVDVADLHSAPSQVRLMIDDLFRKNGIIVPFPHLDVHFDESTPIQHKD